MFFAVTCQANVAGQVTQRVHHTVTLSDKSTVPSNLSTVVDPVSFAFLMVAVSVTAKLFDSIQLSNVAFSLNVITAVTLSISAVVTSR